MSEDQLVNLIDEKITDGIGAQDTPTSEKRQDVWHYYMGEKYGDEKDGRSAVITREVLETIEWAMPSLVRIFLGGTPPVEMEAVGPDDEEQSELETAVLQDQIEKASFVDLHGWMKDALMNPTAYVKVWMDEEENVETEQYEGLLEPQLVELLSQEGVEPVAQDVQMAEIEGMPVQLFSVEIKRTQVKPKLCIEALPGEEVVVDQSFTKLDLDSCAFVCHRTRSKTMSDLIEAGLLTVEQAKEISVGDDEDDDETYDRREDEVDAFLGTDNGFDDPSMRRPWYEESIIRVDYDGDGIAERRRVVKIGRNILANEEMDYQPIVAMSSILLPHRHTGLPIGELAMIWQRIQSTLMRQLLDNTYRVNNPRPVVGPGIDLDSLMTDVPNEPITGDDINDLRMEPTTPIIQHLLPTMQALRDRAEGITGISRSMQGMDNKTLQESGENAFLSALQAANQRIEMIARVFAETGFKQMFQKVHTLLRTHQDVASQSKIGGQWVNVNPSEWKTRENVRVAVGTGNASQEQKMLGAHAVVQSQERIAQMGMVDLLNPEKVYNAHADLIEASGNPNAGRYLQDPKTAPPKPPPGPSDTDKMLALQAQVEQQKATIDEQKNQLTQQKQSLEYELKRQDLARKEAELLHKIEQDKTKLELEYSVAIPGGYPHASG